MPKWADSAKTKIQVTLGDTLTSITEWLGNNGVNTSVDTLVKKNDIEDPDYIVERQTLIVDGEGNTTYKALGQTVTIKAFGLQTNADRTLYVSWAWDHADTAEYMVRWFYSTGDGIAFLGSDTTTKFRQSTYSIPDNAITAKVIIKPVSKTEQKDGKTVYKWTAKWSNEKIYYVKNSPPSTPPTPTVTIEGNRLTATVEGLDVDPDVNYGHTTHVIFQIVKNNSDTGAITTGNIEASTGVATYSCKVNEYAKYKVRCKAVNTEADPVTRSDWSAYSGNFTSAPPAPAGIIKIYARDATTVYVDWEDVPDIDSYEVEYTTESYKFDRSDDVQTKTVDATAADSYNFEGLESGKEWFFRVRAVKDSLKSAWTPIKSIKLGTAPAAPTTWSSSTTAVAGEDLTLYWIHNSEDGSSQISAEIQLTINGVTTTVEKVNSTDEDEKDKTSFYSIGTNYPEGTTILWRVRTIGVLPGTYYVQSAWRSLTTGVPAFSKGYPTFNFDSDTGTYTGTGTATAFGDGVAATLYVPSGKTIYRYVSDGDGTIKTSIQKAVQKSGYSDWSIQRTVDIYGNPTADLSLTNASGDAVTTLSALPLYVTVTAGPRTQTPLSYHIQVLANSSYETEDDLGNTKQINAGTEVYSGYFDTSTNPIIVELSANNIDLESNATYTVKASVAMDSGLVAEATSTFKVAWKDEEYWPNAEIGYDPETYTTIVRPYCQSEAGDLIKGITMSLYRREFDGSYTELATGLDNTQGLFITDPHPSLDYARYRVVAKSDATGAVSYYDVPGYPVGETAVIIQWDEEWTNFDVTAEEEFAEPVWSGSLLRLPYNIDVTDSNTPDVSLIEYIGRKNPVSYYGTHLGETATWNVEIDKSDKDTIYALRRLAKWMGDVYVREPSGTGYWASITVSFSQKHCEVTVPVTLDITRVEGGA